MPSSSKKPEVGSLGRIGDARLDLVPPLADCHPGIRPVEYNVVVATAPSTDSDKIGSVYIPDEAKETLDLAMQVGRIVAQSPLAWSYDKWPDPSLKPRDGQIVWFARYAGKEFEGADGKSYRILKDKDIGAVIEERPPTFDEAVARGQAFSIVDNPESEPWLRSFAEQQEAQGAAINEGLTESSPLRRPPGSTDTPGKLIETPHFGLRPIHKTGT